MIILKILMNVFLLTGGFILINTFGYDLIDRLFLKRKREYESTMDRRLTMFFDEAVSKYKLKTGLAVDALVVDESNSDASKQEKIAVEALKSVKTIRKMHSFFVADKNATKLSAYCMVRLEDRSVIIYEVELSPKS